jgi:lipopolysaccharide/colanic/teichoic acid biosynthesis glycosyltransferase
VTASPWARRPLARRLKRAIDVVGAGAALAVAAPVLAVTAAAVAANLGRPVLFRQQRPGKDGQPFGLVKFRTMRPAPSGVVGAAAVASDGDRLTPLGRRLRAWSLDELPTLWNVLRGDMSLVGPRPLLMEYLDRYTPEQRRRHDVPPGITGWAQINGRNALSWDEKFAFDVWYVEHWSLGLDLAILARTVTRVLGRDGIAAAGVATMPVFAGPAVDAPARRASV